MASAPLAAAPVRYTYKLGHAPRIGMTAGPIERQSEAQTGGVPGRKEPGLALMKCVDAYRKARNGSA